MDQLIFASLSHTHYWYEVGMLKVPAKKKKKSRQKEAGVEVACRGHHRQEGIQEGENQGTKTKQTRATTYNMRRARKAAIYIYK